MPAVIPASLATRCATGLTLLACLTGWFLLPNTSGILPGELPGRLGVLQQLFTWWPLALLAAFGFGLWIARLPPGSALRKILVALQWGLTIASALSLLAALYLVFMPRAN